VTLLLDVLELPSRPASNSLLPAAVARLVSAATVAATLAVELEVDFEVLLVLAPVLVAVLVAAAALEEVKRLERAEAWLPEMLLIDIMTPLARMLTSRVSASLGIN
jgi:hypothetical protein